MTCMFCSRNSKHRLAIILVSLDIYLFVASENEIQVHTNITFFVGKEHRWLITIRLVTWTYCSLIYNSCVACLINDPSKSMKVPNQLLFMLWYVFFLSLYFESQVCVKRVSSDSFGTHSPPFYFYFYFYNNNNTLIVSLRHIDVNDIHCCQNHPNGLKAKGNTNSQKIH